MNFRSLSLQHSQLYSDHVANCKMKIASSYCQCLTLAPDFRESNILMPQRKERGEGCLTKTEEQSAALPQSEILGTVQAADTWLPKLFTEGWLA